MERDHKEMVQSAAEDFAEAAQQGSFHRYLKLRHSQIRKSMRASCHRIPNRRQYYTAGVVEEYLADADLA